jgi:hypothetical protein
MPRPRNNNNVTEHVSLQFEGESSQAVPHLSCCCAGSMLSLAQSGVAATDGGSLQAMLATRGLTETQVLVLKDGVVVTVEASDELKGLRVRYREQIVEDEEGARGIGSGTTGEAVKSRKQK